MTNRLATFLGVALLSAQGLVSVGCSSSMNLTTPGTGGSTGNSTGSAGSTGTAGTSGGTLSCDKGGAAVSMGDPCVDVKNKAACDQDGTPGTADDKACWNTCGPNKSGVKNCTCTGGMWSCPTCDYDTTDPHKYDCYKTATAVACPPDPTDTVNMLPASGGACTLPPCQPCGSSTVTSYRDSSGAPKAGWCICVAKPDGSGSVYSCASVNEWAPQCS